MSKIALGILVPAVMMLILNSQWLAGLARQNDGGSVRIVRVVDGDTLVARRGTDELKIRVLSVDTPELHKPGVPVQCYARRAEQATRSFAAGKVAQLTYDAERTDRYGRTLAYVSVGGRDLGEYLLTGGYARTMFIRPNVARKRKYRRFEKTARIVDRGVWSACRGELEWVR